MGKYNICLDIGGTKVLGVVFDENEKIICRVKKKSGSEKGTSKVEETIINVVSELIEKAGLPKKDINAISAGIPGIIDQDKGVVLYTPNMPLTDYNLRKAIEDKFKVKFFVGNDANVGTLGEWKYGGGKGKESIVALFVGTGIGGGIILDNKLFSGAFYAGTELGHIVLNTEGPFCNCGQRGCLESYASKIAITKEIRAQLDRGRKSVLKGSFDEEDQSIKSKALEKAIEEKDSLGIEVIERACYYLAAGIGSFVNIFNPEAIILGGGVIEAVGDYMLPLVKKYVPRFSMPEILKSASIIKATLGDDSIVYGALSMIKGGK